MTVICKAMAETEAEFALLKFVTVKYCSLYSTVSVPMILSEVLQAKANRVVLENTSIVRLKAC